VAKNTHSPEYIGQLIDKLRQTSDSNSKPQTGEIQLD